MELLSRSRAVCAGDRPASSRIPVLDGNVLYRFNTGGPVSAGVITYVAAAGKQYVKVMSGAAVRFWRTPSASSTVIIFSLP